MVTMTKIEVLIEGWINKITSGEGLYLQSKTTDEKYQVIQLQRVMSYEVISKFMMRTYSFGAKKIVILHAGSPNITSLHTHHISTLRPYQPTPEEQREVLQFLP